MKKIDWSKTPLRKPLAVYSALLIGISVLVSLILNREMQPGTVELLKWLGMTAIGGYYTTSTIEDVKGGGK
jgi:ABC-type multidrug transport system permease subunit